MRHEDGVVPAVGFRVVVVVVEVVDVVDEPAFDGADDGVVTGGVDVWKRFSRPEQSTLPPASTHVCAVPAATIETEERFGTFVGIAVAYEERPIWRSEF